MTRAITSTDKTYEVLQFDKAVELHGFAEQDGDTLVIVTADHETWLLKNGTND